MSAASRGRFIVLEGIEGTGKSTQAARLARGLRARGLEVVETREPGGTPVGERIRELVLHASDIVVPPISELLLILAARSAFVSDVVRPALERGAWVVSDRFDLSTFAYQGYGRGIDLASIQTLNDVATGGLVPDLYLVLDVDPALGRARQRRQGKAPDRIESAGDAFLGRVRQGYVELVDSRPQAVLIAADGSEIDVEGRIQQVLSDRFPATRASRSV